jgi:uncharacterized protein (TIGR03067 family)
MEDSGDKVPEGMRLTAIDIAGDKLILTSARSGQVEMAFSINPSTSPRSLEIVAVMGAGNKARLTGIYALEGDRLRVCRNDSGHGRAGGSRRTPRRRACPSCSGARRFPPNSRRAAALAERGAAPDRGGT